MTLDWGKSIIPLSLVIGSIWCAILALGNITFMAVERKRKRRRTPVKIAGIEEVCPRISASQLEAGECEGVCCICLGEFARKPAQASKPTLRRLCCGHVFHAACIDVWIGAGKPCPMCRAPAFDATKCTAATE